MTTTQAINNFLGRVSLSSAFAEVAQIAVRVCASESEAKKIGLAAANAWDTAKDDKGRAAIKAAQDQAARVHASHETNSAMENF